MNWVSPVQCGVFGCKAYWICKDAVNTSNIQRDEVHNELSIATIALYLLNQAPPAGARLFF